MKSKSRDLKTCSGCRTLSADALLSGDTLGGLKDSPSYLKPPDEDKVLSPCLSKCALRIRRTLKIPQEVLRSSIWLTVHLCSVVSSCLESLLVSRADLALLRLLAFMTGMMAYFCLKLSYYKNDFGHKKNTSFVGFIGLVGKDPDIERGLLIDTGASINLFGAGWFKRYHKSVIDKYHLWYREYDIQSNVTGIEGKSMGTNKAKCVPGNLKCYTKSGKMINIPASFDGQEVSGGVPALLGLPSMVSWGVVINTRNHTFSFLYKGEEVTCQLIYTRSGHYILPIDEICSKTTYSENAIEAVFYEESQNLQDDSLENIYEGKSWEERTPHNFGTNQEFKFIEPFNNLTVSHESDGAPKLDSDVGLNASAEDKSERSGPAEQRPPTETLRDNEQCTPVAVGCDGSSRSRDGPSHEGFRGDDMIPEWGNCACCLEVSNDLNDVIIDEYFDYDEFEDSARVYLNEHRFYYEGPNGKKIHLIDKDAPCPEIVIPNDIRWDVIEINSEEEPASFEAASLGLVTGPPFSMGHGWDLTNKNHQDRIKELCATHMPRLMLISSVLRPWGNKAPRDHTQIKEWLTEHDKKHIPFLVSLCRDQINRKGDFLVEVPLGSELLESKEIKNLLSICFDNAFQVTDMCMHKLYDPETNYPIREVQHSLPHLS